MPVVGEMDGDGVGATVGTNDDGGECGCGTTPSAAHHITSAGSATNASHAIPHNAMEYVGTCGRTHGCEDFKSPAMLNLNRLSNPPPRLFSPASYSHHTRTYLQ